MTREYLTVQALTKYIKRKFDVDPHLQSVYVKGEISNFKQHQSGHIYFTLKDEGARMNAVMFSKDNKKLAFRVENGQKVLIRGDISVFETTGNYQIYVKEMQTDGIGNLYLAYEQLKQDLASKGYFDEKIKKPIPSYPQTIGVITSPTGAAIRDILTTLKRRYPIANIYVFPAIVQGDQAAPSIVKQIENAQKFDLDCLIVGRGGGSIEDLWAFNEKIVAQAIFNCPIPIISAVGHETDFTICDFVADLRAPTPTAAAELAVPSLKHLMEQQLDYQSRIFKGLRRHLEDKKQQLSKLSTSYAFRFPYKLYEQHTEKLDFLNEKLVQLQQNFFDRKKEQVSQLTYRILLKAPHHLVEVQKKNTNQLTKDLNSAMNLQLLKYQQRFVSQVEKLESYSPLKVMARGYSLTYNEEKKVVRSVSEVNEQDTIIVNLTDGQLYCEVKEKRSEKM